MLSNETFLLLTKILIETSYRVIGGNVILLVKKKVGLIRSF
jgi:hypothetical protein